MVAMEDIELRSGGIELVRPVELVDLYFHAGIEQGTEERRRQQLSGCLGVITARDLLSANSGSPGELVGVGLIEGERYAATLTRPVVQRDFPDKEELAKDIAKAQKFYAIFMEFTIVVAGEDLPETEHQDGWVPN